MKITFSALLVGALVLLSEYHRTDANIISFGGCPTVTPAAVANDPFATPNWFEQRRFPSRSEFLLRCVQYTFGAAPANVAPVTHTITITGTKGAFRIRPITSTTGTLTQSAADAAANPVTFTRWTASFTSARPFPASLFPSSLPTQYTVLAVDTVVPATPTWVALYACRAVGLLNIQNLYILTTVQNPNPGTVATAIAAARAAGVTTTRLIATPQTNC